MLRIVITALVVALCLNAWGAISSRVLPWPEVYGPPVVLLPPAAVTADTLSFGDNSSTASRVPNGSTFAPPVEEERTLVATSGGWPVYAYYRDKNHFLTENEQLTYLGLNISLGVIVALVIAVLGLNSREGWRRLTALCLLGLASILVTDVAQGIWMQWPRQYIAVLCADHLGAAVLAGGAAILVLHFWKTDFGGAAPSKPAVATPGSDAATTN